MRRVAIVLITLAALACGDADDDEQRSDDAGLTEESPSDRDDASQESDQSSDAATHGDAMPGDGDGDGDGDEPHDASMDAATCDDGERCDGGAPDPDAGVMCTAGEPECELGDCESLLGWPYWPALDVDVNPLSIAAGDLDGDGRSDLVTAHQGDGELTVRLNLGGEAFANPVTYPVTGGNHAIADLDGDGALDVAVVSWTDLRVLLNRGDGTLADAVSYTLGTYPSYPTFVLADDIDRDGDVDLLTNPDRSVVIFVNNGDGTFVRRGSGPGNAFDIAVADFNHDGYRDIAVAELSNSAMRVSFFRPLSELGVGFPEDLIGPVRQVSYPVGGATAIVAEDLDGDGWHDVAIAGGARLSVFINEGDESFAARIDYPAVESPDRMIAADFNEDGSLDIALANGRANVAVLLNHGNGTLSETHRYVSGSDPVDVAAGDFDGDGHLDLASVNLINDNVGVISGRGDGRFVAPLAYPTAFGPSAIAIANIHGRDDFADLAVAGMRSGDVAVHESLGDGTFANAVLYDAGNQPTALIAVDLNGDATVDLVAPNADGYVAVLYNTGVDSFNNPVRYRVGREPVYATAADLNQDGAIDLAVANRGDGDVAVLLAEGTSFRAAERYAAGASPTSVAAADLDGDGFAELLVTNAGDDSVSVLVNLGDGTFGEPEPIDVGSAPAMIIATDVNADGWLDALVANQGSDDVSVLLGDGEGALREDSRMPAGQEPQSLSLGDFDGDGLDDVAVSNNGNSNVTLLRNAGGALEPLAQRHVAAGDEVYPTFVAAADLDLDGRPDIAVANERADHVSVLQNICGGEQPRGLAPPSGLSAQVVTPARNDLTWRDNTLTETGFILERATAAGDFGTIATLPANTVTFTDRAIAPATSYRYRVTAIEDPRRSRPSNVATITSLPSCAGDALPSWARTYHAAGALRLATATAVDDGYRLAGTFQTTAAGTRAWIAALSEDGLVCWSNTYSGHGSIRAIRQTADGGYVVTGNSPIMADAFGSVASKLWVAKLDADGVLQWQWGYFGPANSYNGPAFGVDVLQTDDDGDGARDDGYVVAVHEVHPAGERHKLVKLDADGDLIWTAYQTQGASQRQPVAMRQLGDTIVVLLRRLTPQPYATHFDLLFVTGSNPSISTRTYAIPGDGGDVTDLEVTADSGIIVSGFVDSDASSTAQLDGWLVKLASDGAVQWQNTFGGPAEDRFQDVAVVESGYVATGLTHGFGAVSSDVWAVALTDAGAVRWQQRIGGAGGDRGVFVSAAPSGEGYVIAAYSQDPTSELTVEPLVWALKMETSGALALDVASGVSAASTTATVTDVPGAAPPLTSFMTYLPTEIANVFTSAERSPQSLVTTTLSVSP